MILLQKTSGKFRLTHFLISFTQLVMFSSGFMVRSQSFRLFGGNSLYNQNGGCLQSFAKKIITTSLNAVLNSPTIGAGTNIVLWRGEGTKGYSLQFRHLEFINSYRVSQSKCLSNGIESKSFDLKEHSISFSDATTIVDEQDDLFGAMQYIHSNLELCEDIIISTSKRSSLVRAIYRVIAVGDSYEELAHKGLNTSDSVVSNDLLGNVESETSWCLRVKRYGSADAKKGARFGTSKRSSMKQEKEAIVAMKPLLQKINGSVRLKNPDCALYVFEGLNGAEKMLVRKVASGAATQTIAPNTRRCITRTPLCPLASFIMCNLARVKADDCVLDPYAGSCSTLLASAMIAPSCQTVGIEIASENHVDLNDVVGDFKLRGLKPPVALIHGDCRDSDVRDLAIRAIGGQPFDAILADPPYGLREKKSKDSEPPLVALMQCIEEDRNRRKPLLRRGGRLVAFVPTDAGENISDGLPCDDKVKSAGLQLLSLTEQPLNDTLSRWLAVYQCTI